MTKPQSQKNATHAIIGSPNKPLLTYIFSLFKESRQFTLAPNLIYANNDFSSLHTK